MKKIFFLFLLTLTSCYQIFEDAGCGDPLPVDTEYAKWYYRKASTKKVEIEKEKAKQMFGCYYRMGDEIYSYSTLEEHGYLLVREYMALTYYRQKD